MIVNMVVAEVFCTLDIEGVHNWPECPIEEVKYLRDPHRHIFRIKANAIVNHDNRFIEFIELKHAIRRYMENKYWVDEYNCCYFGAMSCEMIARELIDEFNLSSCEVSEDGENGAILTVVK